MGTYLTAGTARDVAEILDALNQLDERLVQLAEGRKDGFRAELGFCIDIVDEHGDNLGWIYNEVGPGCWGFTDKDPRPNST